MELMELMVCDLTDKPLFVVNDMPVTQGVPFSFITDSDGGILVDSDGSPIIATW